MSSKNKYDLTIEIEASTRLLSKASFDEVELEDFRKAPKFVKDVDEEQTIALEAPDDLEDCPSSWLRNQKAREISFVQIVVATIGLFLMLLIALVGSSEQSFKPQGCEFLRSTTSHLLTTHWKKPSRSQVRRHSWTLSQVYSTSLNRTVLSTNGQIPGVTIEADQGDILQVTVKNDMAIATTIHWHGISQQNSNDQDGVPSITQYPILPGETYEYRFKLHDSGTFWWHAHGGTARLDGLYGAVIVHSSDKDQQLFDDRVVADISDMTVFLTDWYENNTESYIPGYLSSYNVDLEEPKPSAIMINGVVSDKGTYSMPLILPTKSRSSRYWRLRFINVGAIAEIRICAPLRAGGMTVIEADSTSVRPVEVTSMNLAVGQRYSVLIDTDDYASDNAVSMSVSLDLSSHRHHHGHHSESHHLSDSHATQDDHDGHHASPIHEEHDVAYEAPHGSDDMNSNSSANHLHDGMLHPLSQTRDPTSADSTIPQLIVLDLGAERANNFTRSTINHSSYVPANHPILQQYSHTSKSQNSTGLSHKYSPDISTLSINQTEDILILFNNTAGGNHPMHIHGHQMHVLATDTFFYDPVNPFTRPFRPFDSAAIESLLHLPIAEQGIYRDTVNVEKWALVKVTGLGRGIWAIHCHSIWHEISGMMMTLEVR